MFPSYIRSKLILKNVSYLVIDLFLQNIYIFFYSVYCGFSITLSNKFCSTPHIRIFFIFSDWEAQALEASCFPPVFLASL